MAQPGFISSGLCLVKGERLIMGIQRVNADETIWQDGGLSGKLFEQQRRMKSE